MNLPPFLRRSVSHSLERGASLGLIGWASWALAAAPWFWIFDFAIDLPTTLAGLLYLAALLRGEAQRPRSWFWLAVLVGLWGLFLIGAAFALRPADALPLAVLWLRHPLLLAAVLAWLLYQSQRPQAQVWQPLAWSFTIAALFVALDGWFQWSFGFDIFGKPLAGKYRLTGPLDEATLGFFLLHLSPVILASALAGFGPWPWPRQRLGHWLSMGLAGSAILAVAGAIMISGERLFALWFLLGLVGLALLLLISRPKQRSAQQQRWVDLGALGLAALVLLGCLFVAVQPKLRSILIERSLGDIAEMAAIYAAGEIPKDTNGSYANIHLRSLEAINHDPLTGLGMRGFRFYCRDVLGLEGDAHARRVGCTTHPHQSWLNIAVAGGLPALALALVLAATFLIDRGRALWCARQEPRRLVLAFLPLWVFAPLMISPLSSEGIFVNFSENLLWTGLALTLAMEKLVNAGLRDQDSSGASEKNR